MTIMVHRKGIIHCSCANALYPAKAIEWDKCNLTCVSTYFIFEDFSWILLWATDNVVQATCGLRACSWTTLK